jgi:hypothetical protein
MALARWPGFHPARPLACVPSSGAPSHCQARRRARAGWTETRPGSCPHWAGSWETTRRSPRRLHRLTAISQGQYPTTEPAASLIGNETIRVCQTCGCLWASPGSRRPGPAAPRQNASAAALEARPGPSRPCQGEKIPGNLGPESGPPGRQTAVGACQRFFHPAPAPFGCVAAASLRWTRAWIGARYRGPPSPGIGCHHVAGWSAGSVLAGPGGSA